MTQQYYGTGRRKTSTARVFMKPGSGKLQSTTKTSTSILVVLPVAWLFVSRLS